MFPMKRFYFGISVPWIILSVLIWPAGSCYGGYDRQSNNWNRFEGIFFIHHYAFFPDGRHAVGHDPERFVPILMDLVQRQPTGAPFKDVSDGSERRLGHSQDILCLDVSSDGKFVLSGSADGTIVLWSVDTRRLVYRLNGHKGSVRKVKFAPDGRSLMSHGDDLFVKIWSVDTAAEKVRIGPAEGMASADGSFDHERVLTGGQGLKLWNMLDGSLLRSWGASLQVTSVAISPNTALALSGDSHGRIHVWDTSTGALKSTLFKETRIRGDVAACAVNAVTFSPGAIYAASGSECGYLRVWDVTTGRLVRDYESRYRCVPLTWNISPFGKWAIYSSMETGAWIGDIATEPEKMPPD